MHKNPISQNTFFLFARFFEPLKSMVKNLPPKYKFKKKWSCGKNQIFSTKKSGKKIVNLLNFFYLLRPFEMLGILRGCFWLRNTNRAISIWRLTGHHRLVRTQLFLKWYSRKWTPRIAISLNLHSLKIWIMQKAKNFELLKYRNII